jgi:glycosyltransferase involved in cell wall biosynthesis
MKIAILSYYSGIYYRGAERWVSELAERLSKNHETVVYQSGPQISKAKYRVVSTGFSFKPPRSEFVLPLQKRAFLDYRGRKIAQFALCLLPKMWKENFDIVIPIGGGWESAFARLLTWIKRKRMIIVGHSGIGWDDRNNLWCFPDTFVALSPFAERWARKVNPLVRTVNIPDGVDIEKFSPKGKSLNVNLKRPIVLCVGALTASKRTHLIIRAVSKLKNTSLLVVGKGEEEKKLVKLGKKLLGKRFLLTSCDFEKMPEVYRCADILVSTSTPSHSFEMVLLEAMATNLPVIANNDPIRKGIIGDAGILIDPTNIEVCAQAIIKGLETDWKDKPRRQAEKYSWDKVFTQYEKLFDKLT